MRRLLWGLALGAACGAALVGSLLPRPAAAEPAGGSLARPPDSAESAREELAVRVTPEMTRYSNIRYGMYFGGALVNALVLLYLLRSGLSARFRDIAERRGRNGLVRAAIYWSLFGAAYGLLTLPLTFYATFLLPHQYGLSTQKLGGWVLDGVKGFALTVALGSPVLALLYWTIRRSPRRWWIGFWLASVPLLVLTILLGPLVIDPLFNRFRPLQDVELRDRILALAHRAGIQSGRVFEVDASTRTNAVNAYVTGLGGSARIVLWDTLLKKLDR
ncbi:MAG TPA: M48 family metalloprotease, partial [Armatimonadota bacterium]|nr:M48 family metalloprotease [Armatimonadota bacterium]